MGKNCSIFSGVQNDEGEVMFYHLSPGRVQSAPRALKQLQEKTGSPRCAPLRQTFEGSDWTGPAEMGGQSHSDSRQESKSSKSDHASQLGHPDRMICGQTNSGIACIYSWYYTVSIILFNLCSPRRV